MVNNFTLWVDGKPVEGKVLSAEEARRTYEETVSQLRDPALLEYIGRGAVQASIFPIPPDGERRIELEYSQALTADNGLVHYSYPLNTEKFSSQPLEERFDQGGDRDLRSRSGPSTRPAKRRGGPPDDNHVVASYEANNVCAGQRFRPVLFCWERLKPSTCSRTAIPATQLTRMASSCCCWPRNLAQ